MRRVLCFIIGAVSFLMPPCGPSSCECTNMWFVKGKTPEGYIRIALTESHAVFLGKAILTGKRNSEGVYSVLFSVQKAWKGVIKETYEIAACGSQECKRLAGCAYEFKKDEEYLVICSGSVLGECSGQIRVHPLAPHEMDPTPYLLIRHQYS